MNQNPTIFTCIYADDQNRDQKEEKKEEKFEFICSCPMRK